MGPPGGDVRALAADLRDPRRVFLGTADGHIFASVVDENAAALRWELLGRAGTRTDGVVTSILVDARDPRTLFVSLWYLDPVAGGGVFRSPDGGRTWQAAGLAGQAVRALAQSASDPDVLIAGTLDGAYRSRDAARTWERISPEGHEEIRNLDSVAIDPRNPQTIYIGTYHLPWKTADGGRTWSPIHEGMLDDSDVMSILVDRTNPSRIFASACSGIYRSENSGALWKKIQGIPFSARRTHVILQHPREGQTVYAGTTEGLWKTTDAGATWKRITPAHWVVNALAFSAGTGTPERLVVGTEWLGALVSDDAGKNFSAANDGFNHRRIVALALDRDRSGRVLAVLTNAPEAILATEDGGGTWAPLGPGLNTEKLLRVYASPAGWWAALERGGLMRYDEEKRAWSRTGTVAGKTVESTDASAQAKRKKHYTRPMKGPRPLTLLVHDMAFSIEAWFAATPGGLLVSRDSGATWTNLPLGPVSLPVRSVRASRDGRRIWVVSLRGMPFSENGGETWTWRDLPFEAGGALRIDTADAEGRTLLAAAGKGLYISRDSGTSWQLAASGLPDAPLQDLAVAGDVFLAAMQTGGLFLSGDQGRTWSRIEGTLAEGHFPVVVSRDAAAIIFAASATEGLYAVELKKDADAVGASGSGPRSKY